MNAAIEKLARILRTSPEILGRTFQRMQEITQKLGVPENLLRENQERINDRLLRLGLKPSVSAEYAYAALLKEVLNTAENLSAYFNRPKCSTVQGCQSILAKAFEMAGKPKGYFLKKAKAQDFLRTQPPRNLLQLLGYQNIDQALDQEDFFALFSSIRFAEPQNWLNDVFFRQYEAITPEDFEEREVSLLVLPERWREIGQKFVGKKLHHISHLKELGVIFVIPSSEEEALSLPEIGEITEALSLETIRAISVIEILTLVLHYLHEVPFYSKLFRSWAGWPDFTKNFISALRGDVIGLLPQSEATIIWRVIQRYLAKDNPSDPRLFEPHVNPEAIHWAKAERDLAKLSQEQKELDFSFWIAMNAVGDFFPTATSPGEETLLSFDLIDNLISVTKRSSVFSKYLYHQQEALWNKIFSSYMGEDKLEAMIIENLHKGYIEL